MFTANTRNACWMIAALAVVGLFGGVADAAGVLRVDVKDLFVQAEQGSAGSYTAGFGGVTHEGRFILEDQTTTNATISVGGIMNIVTQTASSMPGYSLNQIDGELTFVNGEVAGGTINIQVNRPDSSLDTLSALVTPLSGRIASESGGYFVVSAALSNLTFNNATFGGIDVSWLTNDPSATLLQIDYNPDKAASAAARLDATAAPTPTALIAGAPVLAGLLIAARKRRRRAHMFGN